MSMKSASTLQLSSKVLWRMVSGGYFLVSLLQFMLVNGQNDNSAGSQSLTDLGKGKSLDLFSGATLSTSLRLYVIYTIVS